jgi:hypothetical protein
MNLNSLGSTVHYGDNALILRLKTNHPALLHNGIIKGFHAAMKMSLLVDDLTKEEKDGLIALQEMLFQMIPSELHFEKAYSVNKEPAPSLS